MASRVGEPSYRAQEHTGSTLHATVSRRTERHAWPPRHSRDTRRLSLLSVSASPPSTSLHPPAQNTPSAACRCPVRSVSAVGGRRMFAEVEPRTACAPPLPAACALACPLRDLRRQSQPCPTLHSFWKVRRNASGVLGRCRQGTQQPCNASKLHSDLFSATAHLRCLLTVATSLVVCPSTSRRHDSIAHRRGARSAG
jgi:hypothetical protein